MQCYINTKNDHQCARSVHSGDTFTYKQYMVRTCAQHGEMVRSGKLLLSDTTVSYKGEAMLTPAHAVCEALELPMDVPTTTAHHIPTHRAVLCGACGAYHPTTADVRACYSKGVVRRDTMHALSTTSSASTKGVLCGMCKQHHPTPAQVKHCYAEGRGFNPKAS